MTTEQSAIQAALDLLRESHEADARPMRWEFSPTALDELLAESGPEPWGLGKTGPTFMGLEYDVGARFPGIGLIDLRSGR